MSKTRVAIVTSTIIATLLGLSPAPSQAGATERAIQPTRRPITASFTAVGYGSGPIDASTGEYHTRGAFIATRLGAGTLTADSDPTAGFTAIETTTNGDQIHITNDPTNPGPPLPTNCPTTGPLASTPYAGGEFITGGTGQYARATGYITYSGCFAFTPDDTTPTGYRFTFTFLDRGTITY